MTGFRPLLNIGAVESRGAEFTLVGDLTANWTITANYAYNDTRVAEGVTGDSIRNTIRGGTIREGNRFVNAPEHQAGLWTRFDFERINSAIAFGADYVSEQISFEAQRVKPFVVYDMSWTTYWDKAQFQINAKNLFDKKYAISGFSKRNGHFPRCPQRGGCAANLPFLEVARLIANCRVQHRCATLSADCLSAPYVTSGLVRLAQLVRTESVVVDELCTRYRDIGDHFH